MDKLKLNVADFSINPGPRARDEGPYSGEEFREEHLDPKYAEALTANKTLLVNLDGTIGYGTSWLEEVFGGLTRMHNKEDVLKRLEFISEDETYLIEDIKGYIHDA